MAAGVLLSASGYEMSLDARNGAEAVWIMLPAPKRILNTAVEFSESYASVKAVAI